MRLFANFKVRILLILLEQAINKHLKMITFNPFTPNAPWKHQTILRFSDIFRG